jgi:hypothetical protein
VREQRLWSERLRQQGYRARLVFEADLVGVAGHVQDGDGRGFRVEPAREFPAAHEGHGDVGEHQFDAAGVAAGRTGEANGSFCGVAQAPWPSTRG